MLLSTDQVAGFRREGVLFPQRALDNGDALRRAAPRRGAARLRAGARCATDRPVAFQGTPALSRARGSRAGGLITVPDEHDGGTASCPQAIHAKRRHAPAMTAHPMQLMHEAVSPQQFRLESAWLLPFACLLRFTCLLRFQWQAVRFGEFMLRSSSRMPADRN